MKIVVCSDAHGFYDELMEALHKVNFNPETDLFISLGDVIDRGEKPEEMINFMLSLPNKILVKGNHESLFEDFVKRRYPFSHDWHNGTADSIMNLSPSSTEWAGACQVAMEKMKPLLDQTVDYYETEHYVFVHSSIPIGDDWREAHARDWEDARWGNPFESADYGILPKDKILVFGHFHTSWAWARDGVGSEWGEDACFKPYYGDGYIGIDACTAYSGICNVLVLEDDLLEENK